MNKEFSNLAPEDDFILIQSFLEGDRIAFERLILGHKDRVYNLCFRFIGDNQDADDLAQEVFIKVFKSLKKFRFQSSFLTWLYRITINTCKNRIKSRDFKYRKMNVSDNIEMIESKESPTISLEKKEKTRLIQDAINLLPIKQREIIILKDIDGLSYDEVSKITGCKLGTLKSRLSRARLELKKKLRGIERNGM
ncbi:MAG: RNA polymerase sigma factor [Deltaproteobacteria bacterium]|nr:RNA polymerase sigma factor [Deltaproteobacteria bacterium]